MGVPADESRNFVFELIGISMYCITYLRNLFPETSYCDAKLFDTLDPDLTSSYICVKKLRKDASKSSDIFIDYIEKGIFQAIRLKYLKGILFNIHASKNSTCQSEETYLFGIDYNNNLVSLNNEETVTGDSITRSTHTLVKRLIVLTQTLDTPTRGKFFTIRLLFNEACPPKYQPPFFQDATFLEPNIIRLEADSQGLEIGFLKTSEGSAQINVLVAKRNSDNCVDVDPFDLLADDYLSFDDDSLNSLHLSSFVENSPEPVEATQIIVPLELVKCKICHKEINPVAQGYDQPLVRDIPCFECLFKGNIDPDLVILQKVRILCFHYQNYGFPDFNESLDIIKVKDPEIIKIVFNRLFNDGILVITNKAQFATNSVEFRHGSGIFSPSLEGIIDNNGTKLIPNREYFVSFVPKLSDKMNYLVRDSNLSSIYFPNYKVLKLSLVMNNLNKFRKTNPNNNGEQSKDDSPVTAHIHPLILEKSPESQWNGSNFLPTCDGTGSSNQLTLANEETSPTTVHSEEEEEEESTAQESEISNSVADLSFSESLQLLSQQLVILMQHQTQTQLTSFRKKTRKAARQSQSQLQSQPQPRVYKKKKKKVSINSKISPIK